MKEKQSTSDDFKRGYEQGTLNGNKLERRGVGSFGVDCLLVCLSVCFSKIKAYSNLSYSVLFHSKLMKKMSI